MKLKLDSISRNPYDTREDYGDLTGLMASIKRFGMLQPLPVRKTQEGYELIFGGRRLEALREIGAEEVDVDIKEVKDEDMILMGLFENIHRKDLNPVELGRYYSVGLRATGLNIKEFSKLIGDSTTKISNYLAILNLPKRILERKEKYSVDELLALARLQGYSQTLRTELENIFQDHSLPQTFLREVVRVCIRVHETNLPADRKLNVCYKILWEDYSKLGLGEEKQIEEFANQVLQQELLKYEQGLKRIARARAALKGKKTIKHVTDILNYDKKLDGITELLRRTNFAITSAKERGFYEKSSKKSRNKFDFWVHKLVGGLEKILLK